MPFPDTIVPPELAIDEAEAVCAFLAEFGLNSDDGAIGHFHRMLSIEVANARAQESFPALARAVASGVTAPGPEAANPAGGREGLEGTTSPGAVAEGPDDTSMVSASTSSEGGPADSGGHRQPNACAHDASDEGSPGYASALDELRCRCSALGELVALVVEVRSPLWRNFFPAYLRRAHTERFSELTADELVRVLTDARTFATAHGANA